MLCSVIQGGEVPARAALGKAMHSCPMQSFYKNFDEVKKFLQTYKKLVNFFSLITSIRLELYLYDEL